MEYTALAYTLPEEIAKIMLRMSAAFDYDRFDQLFKQLNATSFPAELHGHLVGQLSAGNRLEHAGWLDVAREVIDGRGSPAEADRVLLIQLYDATLAQLAGSGFALTLLLPDDEAPIEQRAQALGQWCEAFLGGFGLVPREQSLSEEADSVLADFAAIAQVQTDLEESEANEVDFMEVIEYVRVAVLMLFSECQPADRKPDQPPASLH